MEGIEVTIGILTRNSEKTIGKCLKSIINSTFPKDLMEIIIVDNVSEDETLKIVREMLENSGTRHKILINRKLGYIGLSRQMIIDNSEAEYVLWIDSDAIIPPTFIESQYKFIKQNNAAIVFPYMILAANTHSVLARMQGYAWSIRTVNALRRGKTPFLGTLGSIMKINVVKKVGGFNMQRIGRGEDLELIIKILKEGYRIAVNPHAVIYHYMRENWCDIVNSLRPWEKGKQSATQSYTKLKTIMQRIGSTCKRSIMSVYFSIMAFSEFRDWACFLIPIYEMVQAFIEIETNLKI